LTGGGSLGAVQVGMLQALADHDINPDVLVGTSAGAINAAYVASYGMGSESLANLATIWVGLRRRDIFPVDPYRQVLAIAGQRPSLCSNSGLKSLVQRHLSFGQLEDAPIPLHIVATNLLDGDDVLMSKGDALSAILASAAIPGIYPTVQREGLTLIDGGFANSAALSENNVLGADEVFVLPAGSACALEKMPSNALSVAVHALSVLISQRLVTELEALKETKYITVLPPPCPQSVSPIDFQHAAELMADARRLTNEWIDAGGIERSDPFRPIVLHAHAAAKHTSAPPTSSEPPPATPAAD
jgi:NTE family protein